MEIAAVVKDGVVEVNVWAVIEMVLMADKSGDRVGVKESRMLLFPVKHEL